MLQAALDGCSILSAYLWAVYEVLPWDKTFTAGALDHVPYCLMFMVVWFLAAANERLLRPGGLDALGPYLFAVTRAVGEALVLSTAVMALGTAQGFDRDFLVVFCFGIPVSMLLFRAAARTGLWCIRRHGYNLRRTIIIGANQRAAHLVDVMFARGRSGHTIEGVLEDDPERMRFLDTYDFPCLGGVHELEDTLNSRTVHEVFVCLPLRSFYETIQNVAVICENAGTPVRLIADLFPLRVANSRLMYIEDIPLLSLSAVPETQAKLALKRGIDLAVSSVLLALLSPLFLLIALLIKLESKGPVFFAQERVGQNQRRFKMLKFRSMVAGAEKMRDELEDYNEADGPVFKIRDDPRITRLGKFLRKYSLDEFPQLINVLWGQMSLVGPRPPIASEVEQYSWDQRRRLSVRPGMTGLWQVSGRSDISFEQWVELDLTYIDSWSLAEDCLILLKTFKAVLQGRGAA